MIIYFADRKLNILGQASTSLPEGLIIKDDLKTGDVDSGVASFDCTITFNDGIRNDVKKCAEVGNYILRSHGGENEFYTIIDAEVNTSTQEVYMYAEDAGLDLLNEVVGAYTADKAYPVSHYIDKFAYDSGFVIGLNEIPNLTRKLSWDGETTATERLASVATQFDGCEISYSFEIKGLTITNKFINIHKKRGKDIGVQLRLNKEIESIVTKKSIANLATAYIATGGVPEGSSDPITLNGYHYDDGNFYIDGNMLKSREALKIWSRYNWGNEPNKENDVGHIVKTYKSEAKSQSELLNSTLAALKKACEIEVNYEVDIKALPENVGLGDTVNIIDDSDELYISARVLKLEESVTREENKATIGDYLIKDSGISQKLTELAEEFAKNTESVIRAWEIANTANGIAQEAKETSENALIYSEDALEKAQEAEKSAENATKSAAEATQKAEAAQTAVDQVEQSVSSIETTVNNANAAAQNAQKAAETANAKADEAKTAAEEAAKDAETALSNTQTAITTAESAVTKAEEASTTAGTAKTTAEQASATANAAKADAEQAEKDILSLGSQLESVSNTMKADYARKTELTEATAALQTQISQNASDISMTATRVSEIDETANNAADLASQAQSEAAEAQSKADKATQDATAAQEAADNAAAAAESAQSEANAAKTAASTAQSVADKAKTDLEAAKADLATVTSRVDATEEEITAAQNAVNEAQAAADKAQADADTAAQKAATAQNTADTAVTNASNAQIAADDAAQKAALAQAAADEAKGDAAAAQEKADEAAQAAATAQSTADTAKQNAVTAQSKADQAALDAAAAQTAADQAASKAQSAQTDLDNAKKNLEAVTSRVDATEEEVAAAQEAVETAQAAADKAKSDAATAQSTANTAKQNAATAQEAADTAKAAADQAQADATEAQKAADKAQADVDALEVRVTTAETKITQNADAIMLAATKTELTETLGGYYTKEQADAAIEVKANEITQTVSNTYATKTELKTTDTKATNAQTAANNAQSTADDANNKIDGLEVGGRNLLLDSDTPYELTNSDLKDQSSWSEDKIITLQDGKGNRYRWVTSYLAIPVEELSMPGACYSVSFDVKITGNFTGLNAGIDFRGENVAIKFLYAQTILTDIEKDKWVRVNASDIVDEEGAQANRCLFGFQWSDSTVGSTIEYKNIKFEKGNKATDWTCAPEDVDSEIDKAQSTANTAKTAADKAQSDVTALTTRVTSAETKINQNSEAIELAATKTEVEEVVTEASTDLHETIVNESASIITKCDGMIFEALKSYTETGDFETFKTSIESQMKLLSDSLQLQFSQTTEQLNQINESLQGQINTITKYFTFDINGLTIGEANNPYKIILDNDRYSMTVNDIEVMWIANGEVYTPELTVTTRMSLLGIIVEKDSLGNINFN